MNTMQHFKEKRGWFGPAFIAAFLVVGAMIAGAILLTNTHNTKNTNNPQQTETSNDTRQTESTSESKAQTCAAWKKANAELLSSPVLPSDWETSPQKDEYINNLSGYTTPIINEFENKIAVKPESLASSAQAFIAYQRGIIEDLKSGSITAQGLVERAKVYNQLGDSLDALCAQ